MDIFPVGITQGDIQTLIQVCKNVLGYSPTRGLDECHLDVTDPAAFLSILKMDNKPLDTLRHKSPIWKHFSISFVAVLDEMMLLELQNETTLKIYSKEARRKYIVIITGDLIEWYDSVMNGCSKEASKELRELMNKMLGHLERVGFREVFMSFHKDYQLDGTFTIRCPIV